MQITAASQVLKMRRRTYMSIDHYDVYGKYTWSVTGGAGGDH
jgi:hypothetical protein